MQFNFKLTTTKLNIITLLAFAGWALAWYMFLPMLFNSNDIELSGGLSNFYYMFWIIAGLIAPANAITLIMCRDVYIKHCEDKFQ